MRSISLIALTALALLLVLAGGVFAADKQCYAQPQGGNICGNCYNPAWDRCPYGQYGQYTMTPATRYGAGPPNETNLYTGVDPWQTCGTFCAAGNIAPGWPYGWREDYWLRPDSNF